MVAEDIFLLYSSVEDLDKNLKTKIESLIDSGLNWHQVLNNAVLNGVLPRFYQNLSLLGFFHEGSPIPSRDLKELKGLYYAYLGYNMVVWEETKKIFGELVKNNIDFTPIKGVLLAETVYKDKYLRMFHDVDLLFPNMFERDKAEKLLAKLGYKQTYWSLRESVFYKFKGRIKIIFNIHSSVSSFFSFLEYPTLKNLWKTTIQKKIGDVLVRVILPEYMLLIICLHSFRGGELLLKDLSDTLEILKKYPNFNWELFLKIVLEEKLEKFVYIPLQLLDSLSKIYFEKNIVPEKVLSFNSKILEEYPFTKKDVLGLIEEKNLNFPVFFEKLCQKCLKRMFCPLMVNRFTREWEDKFIRKVTWRSLCYYHYLRDYIRKSHGTKYAMSSFFKGSKAFFRLLCLKLKLKSQIIPD